MMDGAELRVVLDRILASKLVTAADIDAALRGKFRTLIRLGLLDPPAASPYATIGAPNDPEPWTTDAHKTLARDVARASVVLLKNAGRALPLDRVDAEIDRRDRAARRSRDDRFLRRTDALRHLGPRWHQGEGRERRRR